MDGENRKGPRLDFRTVERTYGRFIIRFFYGFEYKIPFSTKDIIENRTEIVIRKIIFITEFITEFKYTNKYNDE